LSPKFEKIYAFILRTQSIKAGEGNPAFPADKGKDGTFLSDEGGRTMTLTAEDLLAISQMMEEMLDRKLDARLKPIEHELKSLKAEVDGLKAEVKGLKAEVDGLKAEVKGLKAEVDGLKAEVDGLKKEVDTLKTEIHQIKLFQENIIMPRLNDIEACYTSTYQRYKDHADRMEQTYEDVALLKKVVASHSEMLQRAGTA
jgi:archaellum component FlaC